MNFESALRDDGKYHVSRIILNPFGSLGDLHPYMAVALGLQRRGHRPLIATAEIYREKIVGAGIDFAPVRPDIGQMAGNESFLRKVWDPKRGTELLVRDYIMPALEQSFQDLLAACDGADLLLTHTAAYAGPVVAEYKRLRWLSIALQPMVFFSRYDPPVLPPALWLRKLEPFGPAVVGAALNVGKRSTAGWAAPVHKLRRRLGLPPSKSNPIFEGQFSPFGTLAWFSEAYSRPQPDWPAQSRITGFPFYDQLGAGLGGKFSSLERSTAKLASFLADGPPPVLFTLGSSAVMQPGSFYQESVKAAGILDIRAVLLTGQLPEASFGPKLPPTVHAAPYAPYSELIPRCRAAVHQGGIGTTAQALRAGKPTVIVPWAHDQPDNARRVSKLGCGRSLSRSNYTAARAAAELKSILTDDRYSEKARETGMRISSENGVESACAAIDDLLR